MEKLVNCVRCTKDFTVMNEAPKPYDIPETWITVDCPYCEAPNDITWPRGHEIYSCSGKVA